jgi:hypothetical protein
LKTIFAHTHSEPASPDHRTAPDRTRRKGKRTTVSKAPASPANDEILAVDDRASVRPAQVIESKLTRLLENAVVPVSQLQMRGLLKLR